MTRWGSEMEPELEAFLRHMPFERTVPAQLRERVLARARETLANAGAIAPAVRLAPARTAWAPQPGPRRRSWVTVAWAAAVVLAIGAGGALAALHLRGSSGTGDMARADWLAAVNRDAVRARVGGDAEATLPADELDSTDPKVAATAAKRARPARSGATADPFAVEISLLQRAQAAYTRRDFTAALTLIVEQARRFPNGHLAEEREALRVRSLARLGRKGDARRAASDFRSRFPRSRLLPRDGNGVETPMP
jgi:hypothetical protein